VSYRTLRFALGSLRLRVRRRVLDLHGRARRNPRSAPVVPRPRRPRRGSRRLELTHALVASDLNPRYLAHWPLVRRAWSEIVGLEPLLVLVAERDAVPPELRDDGAVRIFEPLPSVHTAFQAQCIRLLYPALLDSGGVVISDVDMAPLGRRYFHRPASRVGADDFLAYRDVLLPLGEIPVCYNAARPRTWADVFGVHGLEDVRTRLGEWAAAGEYAGAHGCAGWTTDQRILHRTLLEDARRTRRVWILDDRYTGFARLERTELERWGELGARHRERLAAAGYSDFHLLPPDSELAELNELVVELAQSRPLRRTT
jgi:hypothetical protein